MQLCCRRCSCRFSLIAQNNELAGWSSRQQTATKIVVFFTDFYKHFYGEFLTCRPLSYFDESRVSDKKTADRFVVDPFSRLLWLHFAAVLNKASWNSNQNKAAKSAPNVGAFSKRTRSHVVIYLWTVRDILKHKFSPCKQAHYRLSSECAVDRAVSIQIITLSDFCCHFISHIFSMPTRVTRYQTWGENDKS